MSKAPSPRDSEGPSVVCHLGDDGLRDDKLGRKVRGAARRGAARRRAVQCA